MDQHLHVAHIDESSVRLGDESHLYVVTASLTVSTAAPVIEQALKDLLLKPSRRYLRHYDETLDRRLKIANCIAALPLSGALVTTAKCQAKTQENARLRLLTYLLPRLQHEEAVDQVIIESRGRSDKSDKRVVDRLRRSRYLTSDITYHKSKTDDPLPWVADFVAGSWVSDHHHDEVDPWETLTEAHLIEVISLP